MNIELLPDKLQQALLEKQYSELEKIDKHTLQNQSLLGLVACIPYIGSFISASVEGAFTYSDAALFRKIFAFIYELKETSKEGRESFIQEVECTANDMSGNVLCEMISRLDNINKASILANLIKAKINRNIDIKDFFRISAVCERIPYPDLQRLVEFESDNFIEGGITELLLASGALIQSSIDANQNTYILSSTGRKLLKYGIGIDIDLNVKNATSIPTIGMEDIDKLINQKKDDQDMFNFDIARGK